MKGGVCRLPAKVQATSAAAAPAAPTKAPVNMLPYGIASLVDENGKTVPLSAVTGKIVGIYFSASWCGPCRVFSPVLSEFLKAHSQEFAVIFVSLDNSEEAFNDYVKGKGWYCIPYTEDYMRRQLQVSEFQVSMIPTLAICDFRTPEANGKCITTWGKSAVTKNPSGCLQQWQNGQSGVSWMQLLKFW